MLTIAVHNGNFHVDEVFAVATLSLLHPKYKLIRSRDPKKLQKADICIDVGDVYNHRKKLYDHHQETFTKKRPTGIPYASAGLIWLHYGKKLVNSQEAFQIIDKKLMAPIDAMDVGLDIYKVNLVNPYTIRDALHAFRPNWDDRKTTEDKAFKQAVAFAKNILEKEINKANSIKKARQRIKQAYTKSNKKILVFNPPTPNWESIILKEYPNVEIVIYKSSPTQWRVKTAPKKEGSFERRAYLPRSWAGLAWEELAKVGGVKDAQFCHKRRFTAGAGSKAGAIALAKQAVKKY